MSIARIKKNDTVIVISGDHASATGKVLEVNSIDGTAIVEGVNIVKKAIKPSEQNPNGGFRKFEAPIPLCKLMPYDAEKKKGVRISRVKDGDRVVRKAKGTGKVLD